MSNIAEIEGLTKSNHRRPFSKRWKHFVA